MEEILYSFERIDRGEKVKVELCGPDSVIGGTGSSQNRITRGEIFVVHFKVAGYVRLAIQINQQNLEALFRKIVDRLTAVIVFPTPPFS